MTMVESEKDVIPAEFEFAGKVYEDIVEIPSVLKGDTALPQSPDLLKLSESQLEMIAKTIGGKLIYRKVRAMYFELPVGQRICSRHACWRPVGRGKKSDSLYCSDHTKD